MSTCTFHDTDFQSRDRRLFEIVERAYGKRQRVVVFVGGKERAALVDRVLWINKQESFIPHEIVDQAEAGPGLPVAIVTSEMNPNVAEVLVAEGHCNLDYAAGFETIHEFVDRSSPDKHQASRDRFRDYRARQIPVEYSK